VMFMKGRFSLGKRAKRNLRRVVGYAHPSRQAARMC
jgi:hypothetical protein